MAAKVYVTQRMPGARSSTAVAVGSRPKLNTISSITRSLRASAHAWRSRSDMTHRPPVRCGDLRCPATPPRRVLHELAAHLERDLGGELGPLLYVVRRDHHRAASRRILGQETPEAVGRCEVEARERLVQQQA